MPRAQQGVGGARQPVIAPVNIAQTEISDTASLYEKIFSLGKSIFSPGIDYTKVDTAPIVTVVAEAAGAIAAGDEKLIELALTYVMKQEEYYLNQHSVNVCIISLQIGVGAGFEMGHLIELGIAAFLHDIGMTQFEDTANLARKLTQKEYEEIKSHVTVGDTILKKINHGLSDTIIAAQSEIHERMDGSGYPSGKKAIHDYARIIAVADGFESMIHPRPFRPSYSIMDVYKRIFEQKNKYDQAFIKILVDRVGFFPNGSFVQLNTREVGKVIRQNLRSPLRPVAKIIYAEDGRQLYDEEAKEINLTKYPTIHVKKCFLEESEK
ncbi:MAG: HD domain-containing protein [Candidatus Omnitrophica bacterium]|nr:HD domain-containing protein [Candidatus Omnitrophota bacterium]